MSMFERPGEFEPEPFAGDEGDLSAAVPASRRRAPALPSAQPQTLREHAAPLDPAHNFRADATDGQDVPAPPRMGPAPGGARALPDFPEAVGGASLIRRLWFALAFVAPLVIGAVYLFLIAPDQYVTEYRYSVRLPVAQQAAGSAGGAGPLAALFGGNPTPGSDLLDNYTVTDYVRSAQAARDLDAKLDLRAMFGKPSDPFSRLGDGAPAEKLARYWKGMVYSDYDPASGLAVVRVKAYAPEDSYKIATMLMQMSGDLVNAIGNQSQQDSLRFAEMEVERANSQVAGLRTRLAGLRNSRNVIDPDTSIVSGNAALANTLRANLAQIESQTAALMQQLHNPDAPQIKVLRQQMNATRAQLAQTTAQVGGGGGDMASTVGQFEDVNARLANAVQILQNSTANLTQVQSNADSQRLYLTTYVKPVLPESATAPDRWLSMLLVLIGAAMVWLIGILLGNSIREHSR